MKSKEVNPFLEEAKLGLKNRNKFVWKEKDKENKLLDERTGEVTEITKNVYKSEVYDPSHFFKMFDPILMMMLSTCGRVLSCYLLLDCLEYNKSYFYFSPNEFNLWSVEKLKTTYHPKTIQKALKELEDNNIIKQTKEHKRKYFFNVKVAHKGQIHKMVE